MTAPATLPQPRRRIPGRVSSPSPEGCGRRATAKGHRLVYVEDLRVNHPTRTDWEALTRKWRRTTQEGFHLNGTAPAARAKWAVRALAVAASGLAHQPKVLASTKLSRPEKLAAAGMLLRLRLARAG